MPSQTWRQNWIAEKCRVVDRLSRGEAGGSYAEAAILVCATFNALAAELWVGRCIDRFRFVEMLVRLGPQASECSRVSIPLLVQHLEATSRELEAQQIQHAFSLPSTGRVVTGPDVDQCEKDVLSIYPQLNLKELRSFSYASVLYGEIRSSYAHEYKPGDRADSWPMTMLADQKVSYINRLNDSLKMHRLVHFHIEWLAQLAVELASVVDRLAEELPLPQPTVWWIEGV